LNLAKLGLILDANGQIARPEKTILDYIAEGTPTAADFGFEVSDQLLAGLNLSSRLFPAGPSILQSARTQSAKLRKMASRRRAETPETFRRRAMKEQDLVNIDEDIREMDLKTLRRHFGYKNGKIKLGIFCRNVVWQVWRFTQAGKPPIFVQKGGNVRSLRYHVKNITDKHTWSFGKNTDFHKLFGNALSDLTGAGLISYCDLRFIDTNRVDRWVAPSYGIKNVILMAEKRSFIEELLEIGKKYGVTVQATGGVASRVTIETMLLEMADAGHDLTEPFVLLAIVDVDPAGWNIAASFVEQMLELGLGKIRTFRPYGKRFPKQPWIDVVTIDSLDPDFVTLQRHPLRVGRRAAKLADEWLRATGGLYGRGGKDWALSSEAFLGDLDAHVAEKLKPYSPPDYAYSKITAYKSLSQPLKNYMAARLTAQP